MEFPRFRPDERIVSQLPVLFVPGVPEATHVLCGGNGELLRVLVLGLAILSTVILFRATYRVARSGPGSGTDSMTSLLAGLLPLLLLVVFPVTNLNLIACLA